MRVTSYGYLMVTIVFSILCIKGSSLYVQEPDSTLIQTNLDVDNWIYGGISDEEYKREMFDKIIKAKNIVKCNGYFPFYNGEKCISCPDEKPYFSLK